MKVKNSYPQWFIDDLKNSEDKSRANLGTLKKSETVDFICSEGHTFTQKVLSYIDPKGNKKSGCPICKKNRKYPNWFIEELIETSDKEKAIDGSLTSTARVRVRCLKCGYEYETKVGTHIELRTMTLRRGCRECAREKHRQDRIKYIQNNKEKVIESNRKAALLVKQYYKDHPEKLKERGEKYSAYLKEHPDIVEKSVSRLKQWHETHPEEEKKIRENHKVWLQENKEFFIDSLKKGINPEKRKEHGNHYHILCTTTDLRKRLSAAQKKSFLENPNRGKEQGRRVSEWCKNNPDKVKARGDKLKAHLKAHPEIKDRIREKLRAYNQNKEWKQSKIDNIIQTHTKHRLESMSDSFKDELRSILHPTDYEALLKGDICSTSVVKMKCCECGEYEQRTLHNVCCFKQNQIVSKCLCQKCYHLHGSSEKEREIKEFISTLYDGNVQCNVLDIIPPYELDLYYPDKGIAVEYNGAYWHSDIWKKKTTHYQKFYLCRQKGIRLISIFSQDWEYKRELVETILINAFTAPKVIYARDCSVRHLSKGDRSSFFTATHFDGDCTQASVAYGLFNEGELVGAISFGNLRWNKGKNGFYELLRLSYKRGIKVIGGSSRLFHHFIREFNPNYVLSYSDNDYFTGSVYAKLGFHLVSLGEKAIDYQWVKYKSVLNRYSCTVETLLKKYPEYKAVQIEGSVEDFIMKDLGYNKVYRCGNSKWEWFCN